MVCTSCRASDIRTKGKQTRRGKVPVKMDVSFVFNRKWRIYPGTISSRVHWLSDTITFGEVP
jgi:hypothetical protein